MVCKKIEKVNEAGRCRAQELNTMINEIVNLAVACGNREKRQIEL